MTRLGSSPRVRGTPPPRRVVHRRRGSRRVLRGRLPQGCRQQESPQRLQQRRADLPRGRLRRRHDLGRRTARGLQAGVRALHLDLEGDWVSHSGTASGRLPGAGSSPERNQLGDAWPEDWSLAKDRSYGITARLGTGFFAPLGASIYVFGGIRRLEADFRTSYTGCLLLTACLPDEFTNGRERHDEEYDAWIAGRGELRYTDHGSSKRTVRFEEVAVIVPVELESGEIGVGVSVVWRP